MPEPAPPALNETPMTQADYEAELLRILRAHDAAARATLTALIAALPPKAREIHIVVFPDQDGEGTFSVVASLEGPDLFVLNKAIEGHRYLFDVRHTEDGIEPEVPLFGSDGAGFDVQNVIVDTAMQWVGECGTPADAAVRRCRGWCMARKATARGNRWSCPSDASSIGRPGAASRRAHHATWNIALASTTISTM